ncbi:hypothetical protein DBA29_20350 [Xenophilus aerolatus]|nr:hypothetical protein [Xenophilus aerolatus]
MPVATQHPAYVKLLPKVAKTEDAFAGDVLDYVPRLSTQTEKDWKAMVDRPAFYNVTERTTQALVGALIRKPYTLEGVAGDVPHTDETTFDEFIQRSYKQLLLSGRLGLHVDYDEAAGSPKLIAYEFCNIINWSKDFVVIEEHITEPNPDDPFELVSVPQWRELRLVDGLYVVRIWRKISENSYEVIAEQEPTIRGARLDYIPFWFVTPYDCSKDVYAPPLAGLADLNVAHFRLTVDLYHGAHFAALPTPWVSGTLFTVDGLPPQQIRIGSENFIHLEQGSTIGYLEPNGQGLPRIESMAKGVEEQMYAAGSRLLTVKRGVESAEALQLRSGSESATLETLASALEQGLQLALNCYNAWAGSAVEPEVALNRDFTAAMLDPQQMSALLNLYSAGVITLESLMQKLYEGEVVADPIVEVAMLAEQPKPQADAPSDEVSPPAQ